MTGVYKLADKNIQITSLFSAVHTMCADYRTEDDADFSVQIAMSDIDLEREKSAHEDEIEGIPIRHFSDPYLETLAVYRRIAEKIPKYDTVLFHGSCIAMNGEGYLFTAKSGTGKSTHTRLWRELFGDRVVMINDDKPLLHIGSDKTVVYGTPWDGKHHLSTNTSVPLKAMYILERAERNRIAQVTWAKALPILMQQVYRPSDPSALSRTMLLLEQLFKTVRLFRLGCNMDPEAARLAYEAAQQ